MKICVACKTEIHQEASKCPHCQSFQNWWSPFKNMAPLLLTFLFIFIFWSFFMSKIGGSSFEDYKEKIHFTKIKEDISTTEKGMKWVHIIGEIDNQTKLGWKHPDFKITFSDKEGEFKTLRYEKDYHAIIPAKSKEKIAIKLMIGEVNPDYEFKIELNNMRSF